MRDFEEIGKALEKSGKGGALKAIADSPEARRLGGALDANAVERAAKSGDTEQLKSILRRVLSTEDGRALAKKLNGLFDR